MGEDIVYDEVETESALADIEAAIANTLASRKAEYTEIMGIFEKSSCEHVTAMKELLAEEQNTIEKLTEVFCEMVKMLREASTDTKQVETDYSEKRVEKWG